MADEALFGLLRQTADPAVVEALKTSVETDPDRALNRINPLTYAKAHGLHEEETIGGFVHAARLGLFDMSWNMLCPGCGGRARDGRGAQDAQSCPLLLLAVRGRLRADARPSWSRSRSRSIRGVRRIAAHDPDSLSFAEYMRQVFWSSSNDLPEDVEGAIEKVTLDTMELGAGRKGGDVAEPARRDLRSSSIP